MNLTASFDSDPDSFNFAETDNFAISFIHIYSIFFYSFVIWTNFFPAKNADSVPLLVMCP